MINRDNWKSIKAYLRYRLEVDQLSKNSMRLEEGRLRHLLEWAGSQPFQTVNKLRPTFPEHMLYARLDGQDKPLSPVYVKKVIRAAYHLFLWLPKHRPGFSMVKPGWVDTLKAPRMTIEPVDHEAVTLEEVRAMANAPVYSLRDRRIRASAVFWFLSGIRIGAFVSLPLASVDLDDLTVKQWPKIGVRTKNKKHATTYLLDIPDLLDVVRAWDHEVRQACGNDGLWFAAIDPETGQIQKGINQAGEHRHTRARKDLQEWLNRVGLPYHSPHKFRHGHAVYGLKQAKDIPALKAVSQNLMHANLSITDGVYGMLSETDVKGQIMALGHKINASQVGDKEDLKARLKDFLASLE